MDNFHSVLEPLGYCSSEGSESEEDLTALEAGLRAKLPQKYRRFLLEIGGGYLDDCVMDCAEQTPFGEMNIVQLSSLRAIFGLLDSDIVPQEMIVIGHGHFGMETCLA